MIFIRRVSTPWEIIGSSQVRQLISTGIHWWWPFFWKDSARLNHLNRQISGPIWQADRKKKHQFPTDHCSWHVCPNLPVNIQQICSEFPSSKLFHYILIFIPKSNLDSAINQTSQTSLGKNTIQKFWCFMPGNEHTYCTMNDPINQSAWIIRSITSYIVVTHIK